MAPTEAGSWCWSAGTLPDAPPQCPAAASKAMVGLTRRLPAAPSYASPAVPWAWASRAHKILEVGVQLVCEADNLEGLEPIGDGRELLDEETLARKTADAVVEQEGVLLPMHLRKKAA